MKLKSTIRTVHLWLGLITGPIIFIIALSGCLYVFQEDIQDVLYDYRFIKANKSAGRLTPSEISDIAQLRLPNHKIQRIYYNYDNRSSIVRFMGAEYYYMVYIDPYSGKILKVRDMYNDFFHGLMRLHVHLLMPQEIGKKIVSTASLIFLIILMSGLYMWWPKKKGKKKTAFKLKLNGSFKRKVYDFHNVLGFYIIWIAIISAITGLVWGFQWFGDLVYFTTSGKEKPDIAMPLSRITDNPKDNLDLAFLRAFEKYPGRAGYMIFVPQSEKASIGIAANPSADTYYNMDYVYYDQYSVEELKRNVYGEYARASFADKFLRANYDIHTGAIAGFAGKLLMFFASFTIASLPVSGFILWRIKKQKRKAKKLALKMENSSKTTEPDSFEFS